MRRFFAWFMVALLLVEQASVMAGQEVKRASTHGGIPQATYRGGLVTPPLPKPHFVLTDTSGARFDFWNRTRGVVTLLFFGYTYCPDECPMHMANLGAALKRLPPRVAGQVKLVFVTTDATRDTRMELRRWLDNFDKRFVGLTGTPAAIDVAQKAAGVPLAQKTDPRNDTYSVTHANFVVAYTKDNFGHVIYPGGVSEADWIHDLALLVNETWRRP
ncbi:MAG: SCO family protein [Candidatus Sulfotelmatobacter sp.]|jgi:protein SCO1/2